MFLYYQDKKDPDGILGCTAAPKHRVRSAAPPPCGGARSAHSCVIRAAAPKQSAPGIARPPMPWGCMSTPWHAPWLRGYAPHLRAHCLKAIPLLGSKGMLRRIALFEGNPFHAHKSHPSDFKGWLLARVARRRQFRHPIPKPKKFCKGKASWLKPTLAKPPCAALYGFFCSLVGSLPLCPPAVRSPLVSALIVPPTPCPRGKNRRRRF